MTTGPSAAGAPISRVVIVGGGTSGWMCAAALSRMAAPDMTITLVESEEIGVIGVGEATIPPLIEFNTFLGLSEREVLGECRGTLKYGIEFVDWGRAGARYFHPFSPYGRDTAEFPFHQLWLRLMAMAARDEVSAAAIGDIEDYNLCALAARLGRVAPPGTNNPLLATMRHAYHLDATLYAKILRRYAEQKNVQRVEGLVVDVDQAPETGLIQHVILRDGRTIAGDLFIDCSGFRSLLIGEAMDSAFIDWSAYLPCDRAIAMPVKRHGAPVPYTRATADRAGWRWRIPLQHRAGHGYVYSSAILDDDAAHRRLVETCDGEPIADARPLRFRTGHRHCFWDRNCVAIGLAGGFIEPLESTSIHLAQLGIQRLINLWPAYGVSQTEAQCYNRLMTADYTRLRDFILLHYVATDGRDEPFWQEVRRIAIPNTLAEKLELFRGRGRIVAEADDLFTTHNWLAVMLGQGLRPSGYDGLVDRVPSDVLIRNMGLLHQAFAKAATRLVPYPHSDA
ncbi:tryptophan halogenase family protein [Sphingomonas sp.]|uniref:tryptophan halogenase family protein n=1 Tax=Sphingomonas sp. TaxID=28214 RepID=UPI0031D386A7